MRIMRNLDDLELELTPPWKIYAAALVVLVLASAGYFWFWQQQHKGVCNCTPACECRPLCTCSER